MTHDLLSTITSQLEERMRSLRPAVEECERLRADLKALECDTYTGTPDESAVRAQASPPDPAPEPPPRELSPAAAPVVVAGLAHGETGVVAGGPAQVEPGVVALPDCPPDQSSSPACELPCSRPLVSPKVLRLMGPSGAGQVRGRGSTGTLSHASPEADRVRVG